MKKRCPSTIMEENNKLEALEWAVDFMEKYEKKMANRRRVERIKREDDGY